MNKYIIENLESFAYEIREAAAKSFTENYTENLDDFISIQQIILMLQEYPETMQEDIIIDDDIIDDVFNQIRVVLFEVGLSKLAARGVLECAWNEDTNTMQFWKK